ncbi:hypothetical protein HBI56_197850 [Parastagonospora nodorum]|nr:hypothetical protein HBI10_211150 [Parastagonospora nodorum]KAH4010620.1 hypothetical protein HBI13_205080 [Parastagonospora nodorum]KAH4340182.1 hypothetical protein HBH98_193240 [Parastagonospora nodorum]KAH4362752.1 hypothetical protein HBH97_189470 [Parastagonospora nodorum]KAH4420749.1 hypothetical protein HBH99_055950 [Parastagonospora nodorum]
MLPTALLLTFLAAGQVASSDTALNINIDLELTAVTTSGTYTGFVDDAAPNVKQWLGIRYGKAPVGRKRFMPPEPSVDMTTHYYAREYKPICFQQSGNHTGLFWELVPEFQNQDPQSEDCLYLNVWAPKKPAKKVPVLIWVCGGGLQEGGGHALYQIPDQWLEKTESHVVVTFNYRLNVFGFPGARGARENAGFHDARMAVEWARDNIGAFGGDPENMIIWGQSAGAGLVGSYIYANGEDPIVSGAIAMSGAVNSPAPDNSTNFSELAKAANCGGLSAKAELLCMQNVPALRLQDLLQGSVLPGSNTPVPRFRAVVDNVTVFANNTARLEGNLTANIPLITGYTINELAAFEGYISKNETKPPPGFSTEPGPSLGCPVQAEVAQRLKYNLPTYRYLFAGNFSNITPRYWLGAMHSSDLPLVFDTHYQFRGNSTELEWKTSHAMQDSWVSFATDSAGDPNYAEGVKWPRYSPMGDTTLVFGRVDAAAQLLPGSYADSFIVCPSVQ